MMDEGDDFTLSFCRWRFKTIDVTSEKRSIQSELLCETADIYLRMSKEKALETGRLSIRI